VICEWKTGKEVGVSGFRELSQHLPGGAEGNHERLGVGQPLGQNLNMQLPKYKAGVLITQLQCFVI
jgi:hypothetical protein